VSHHPKSRTRSKKSSDRYGAEAGIAYDKNVRDFVKGGRVTEAALDARAALDGPEADELQEAETQGKARAELPLTDRARAAVDRVSRAVKAALHELRH
jgi:pyruvate/2-oxoglutarate dehydrogenase complex dihydrolipoamide acyltransferase (E2) component